MNEIIDRMPTKALISIIVPVYNADKYLDKCVTSLMTQTYSNLEIILVDDGSTDNSARICELLAKKDTRIVVIHQKNSGVSAARNTGIKNARGEYLAFVDGDDYISPYMIEHLYARIMQDQADVAVCGYKRVDEKGHELSTAMIPDSVVSGAEAIRMHYSHTAGIMMIPVNKIYQRRLFDHIRFPEGKRHEDEAVFYLILDICEKVSLLAEPLYYYVQHENSFMRSYSVEHLDVIEAFYKRYLFYLEKGEKYQDLLQKEGEMFAWQFYDVIRHFHPKSDSERKRVREICTMARNMCAQRDVNWSIRERLKLLFPDIYVSARRIKDRLLSSRK